jgi:hypothetical protein
MCFSTQRMNYGGNILWHILSSYRTHIMAGSYRIGHLTAEIRIQQIPAASMFTLEGFPKMLVCVCTATQRHILEDCDIRHIHFSDNTGSALRIKVFHCID